MATEKRLMCVDEFKKNLCHYCNTYMSEEPCEPGECWVHDVIAQTDTVDAVEVTEFNEILYKLECLLCHATGGKYSKAGYSLEDMERMVTDYIEECCDEAVEEKVVHGRWVLAKPRVKGRNATYRCTACGKLRSSYYNDVFQWEYCPCGAKMDGDGNG